MSRPGQTNPSPPGPADACGLLRRLLVMTYDAVAIIAILMLAGTIALALPFNGQHAGEDPVYTVYLVLVWFLYLAWCWRNGGTTLGMRAWRVELVSDLGARPGWGQCLIRFLTSWLSVLTFGAGLLWSLVGPDHLAWHDRLSKTRLVYLGRRKSNRAAQNIDSGNAQ